MKPLKRQPQFDHVNYQHTNLRATFARIRRQMREAAEEQAQKVTQIKERRKA